MIRQSKWVMRIWSNFDDPYFEDHLTEKKNFGGIFSSWDNCVKFKQIGVDDVGHSG